MIPYVDFDYFLFLIYPVAVLIALGVLGWLRRPVVLGASVAIILVQYGVPLADGGAVGAGLRQLAFLGAYAGTGVALVVTYARLRNRHAGRALFVTAIGVALFPLLVTKLYPLVRPAPALADTGGLPPATAGFFDVFGFLGVSYMALRVIDALVVIHDGVVEAVPRAADVASYLLFVPTISAGPIDRFRRFTGALDALPGRRDYVRDVEAGIHRVAQGFLYKFVLAYLLYRYALTPLAPRAGVAAVVAYMYAFSLYLFFDFAGYSAFAIGVGHFFGVRVPENFDAPFRSRSFREMWDRWHITLSWWLRDHVYMRFMLAATRRRWFGGDRRRAHYAGLLLTMGLMGCWHGLAPQYLVYGLYQGGILIAYDVFGRWNERHGWIAPGRRATVASVLVTVNLFCFGLLIFSGRLFSSAALRGAG